ncbi:N-acetyltransferase [Methanosarcina mazei]|uniref:N-acetyltransferase n=2 Tax=Methanosarcina mazei TaxID=2209 RepID=A0A4P8QWN0_METMZ|nr:N-acetyltransferase [Methanosarcina mazei]
MDHSTFTSNRRRDPEGFKTHLFLKAVSEHLIIRCVRTRIMGDTCHIGRLIMHPKWQNQGIGTHLMTEVELIYRDIARFKLFTGSNRSEIFTSIINWGNRSSGGSCWAAKLNLYIWKR